MEPPSSNRSDSETCRACGELALPWFTSCPRCELTRGIGTAQVLEAQFAAPLPTTLRRSTPRWIDLPINAEEPVKSALLRNFLNDQEVPFTESQCFISVPGSAARQLERAVSLWAFHVQLPEDPRHLDTLSSTMTELGDAVLRAIHDAIGRSSSRRGDNGLDDSGLDLR